MGLRTDLHAEGRYDIITDCDLRWWVSRVHNKCNVIQICSLTDVSGLPYRTGEGSMPKMKTHKGAARRFKITGTGVIMRTKQMKSHFRRRKSPRVKRMFDRMYPLDKTNAPSIKRLLPYGVD